MASDDSRRSSNTIVAVSGRRRVLHRVPPQLRKNKTHIYDPVAVPLGPYHHGRLPEFHAAEQLKQELQDLFCGGDGDKAGFLLGKISERVEEIRYFYGGAAGYNDEELAEMMLRDGCFVVCCLTNRARYVGVFSRRLGMYGALFMYRDIFALENQIPLWLFNLLMSSTYEDGRQLQLRPYLSAFVYEDTTTMTELPWGRNGEDEPLHLLEALHRAILHPLNNNNNNNNINDERMMRISKVLFRNSPFRSATDLRAKGVRFKPSSRCVKDVAFFSFSTHGWLHLPVFRASHNSMAFLSNLVAFEMSSEVTTEMGVVRYVNFMKALLAGAEDVRVLREEGVLYSVLANDEEVVRLFRDIDTLGYSNHRLFDEVRIRIEEHCNDKAKTWISELRSTHFRSPWTLIALLAAVFILCNTFIQTYLAIYPRKT